MSAITTAIHNYRNGKLTWPQLFKFLTTRDWPEPERYKDLAINDPLLAEHQLDQRPDYTDGTWDEVLRAHNYGLLTQSEFDAINGYMWRKHTGNGS